MPAKYLNNTSHYFNWIYIGLLIGLVILQYSIQLSPPIFTYAYALPWFLILGAMGGLCIAWSADRIRNTQQIHYVLYIAIRYTAAYFMVFSGYAKLDDSYFQTSLRTLDQAIIELEPWQLAYSFFDHSYPYQATIGGIELLGAALLLSRYTAKLGSLLLSVILVNAILINYTFELNGELWAWSMFALASYPLLLNLKRLYRFFMTNESLPIIQYPLFNHRLLYNSFNFLKLVLIIGPIVMYLWSDERRNKWTRANYDHPIVGAWIIDDVSYSTDSTYQIPKLERLLINKGRSGHLITNDNLTGFEYIVDTMYHQFEMYNFHEFRTMDVKGKYEVQDEDTIYFVGRNRKDSLRFKMIKDQRFRERLR